MVRKIKQYQAEFECKVLNKIIKVATNAYTVDGNWLCSCGAFIKDDPWNHRIIRQGERIKGEEEVYTPVVRDGDTKKGYHVYYWTGRFPNEREHITEFEAYDDADAIEVVNNSHMSHMKYAIYGDDEKQIRVGN